MAKESKKPAGWKAFDQLAKRLVKIPKEELDRAEAKRKKRKRSK